VDNRPAYLALGISFGSAGVNYADLADTTHADEQAAINVGKIQATGIEYTGRPY
jgi:hypothetical protein